MGRYLPAALSKKVRADSRAALTLWGVATKQHSARLAAILALCVFGPAVGTALSSDDWLWSVGFALAAYPVAFLVFFALMDWKHRQ